MRMLADVVMVALTLVMLSLVGAGIFASARRAGRTESSARKLTLGLGRGLTLWLAFTGLVAVRGALEVWTARPPRFPLVPLTAFVALIVFSLTPTAKTLVRAMPRAWPIAAQTFRIGVELALFALHEAGDAPAQVTFEGRNFDILVGLTAPVVAWLVARGRAPRTLVILWNVAGLALLANAIVTIISSVPGPLHRDWPGAPFTAIATWPSVWLPAFLAPLAVLLHVVSLRQQRA